MVNNLNEEISSCLKNFVFDNEQLTTTTTTSLLSYLESKERVYTIGGMNGLLFHGESGSG